MNDIFIYNFRKKKSQRNLIQKEYFQEFNLQVQFI